MTFQPVYYSQQDPKWKDEVLGFGDPGDTIGYAGCALTSAAMLLSGHGFIETPTTLNQKLKDVGGFAGAGIRWEAVSRVHPQVTVKSNVSCVDTDAPLAQVDASVAAGQPVIVMVDSSPVQGLLAHWVLLYAREGDDFLMLDPWPHQTDVKKKTRLTPRYSQGRPLRRSIMHVIIHECFAAGGVIEKSPSTWTSRTRPSPAISKRGGPPARVKADVTWGLNILPGIDASAAENIVASIPAGSLLTLLETDGPSKLGAVNQWVRVRDESGHEGFAAAWHLEKAPAAAPAPAKKPIPAHPSATRPANEASVSSTPSSGSLKLIVAVKSAGAKVFKTASARGEVLSKERGGAKLVVVEPLEDAIPKIGLAGRWLSVKNANGKRGYVDGGLVKED